MRTLFLASVTLALVLLTGCATSRTMLKVGDKAPDVAGEDVHNQVVHLAELRGKAAVVYFYPKDATPGCTAEACAFRDAFAEYEQVGVAVFAVSGDDQESHREFRKEHDLPFLMVADTEGKVMEAYGVNHTLRMASRVTFLVGPDGRVARVFPDVDPAVHAREVLQVAQTLVKPKG